MPTYSYRCASCEHQEDVWQKITAAPLTQCPHCGQEAFQRQLTTSNFLLKGSGWYVTDFRNGNQANSVSKKSEQTQATSESTSVASKDASTSAAATSSTDSAQSTSTSQSAPAADSI